MSLCPKTSLCVRHEQFHYSSLPIPCQILRERALLCAYEVTSSLDCRENLSALSGHRLWNISLQTRISVTVPRVSLYYMKRLQPFLKAGPETISRWGLSRTAWQQFNIIALPPRRAWFSSPHLHSVYVCMLEIEFKDSGVETNWDYTPITSGLAGAAASWAHMSSENVTVQRGWEWCLCKQRRMVFSHMIPERFLKILKFSRNSS